MNKKLLPIKEECLTVLRSMHLPEIDKSSIEPDRGPRGPVQIGNGTFCGVYRVRATESSGLAAGRTQVLNLGSDIGAALAAVKLPHASRVADYMLSFSTQNVPWDEKVKKVLGYYSRECFIWAKVSSDANIARRNNLLEFYGFLESYEFNVLPAFVAKFYVLGDARSYIRECNEPSLTDGQKLYLVSDIAKALAFLHTDCKVVHRDIRGSNILLESGQNRLVGILGDYGSAKEFILDSPFLFTSSSENASDKWCPPEYKREGGFHRDEGPGDIWSLGCTMLELLQEADPWYQTPEGDIHTKIAEYEYPPKGEKISVHLYEFIKRCWKREDKRPSASELHAQVADLAETCAS